MITDNLSSESGNKILFVAGRGSVAKAGFPANALVIRARDGAAAPAASTKGLCVADIKFAIEQPA